MGSKVTAILLNEWILPTGGAPAPCATGLFSRMWCTRLWFPKIWCLRIWYIEWYTVLYLFFLGFQNWLNIFNTSEHICLAEGNLSVCLRATSLRVTSLRATSLKVNLCEDDLCEDDLCEDNLCEDNLCEDYLCEDDLCEDDLCEDNLSEGTQLIQLK